MLEKLKDRNNQTIVVFIIIFIVLLVRLSVITIVEGEKYREMSENKIKKKISIVAKRGEILDRNGFLLAGNTPGFSVQMVQSDMPRKELNDVSIKIIDILERQNENHISFPIIIDENGDFLFSYDNEIENWLDLQGYEDVQDAEVVFNKIVEENISIQGLDVYEQQKILTSMGITPPISVKLMKFLPQIEKDNFLKSYGLEVDVGPTEAFQYIRDYYKIEEDYSQRDSRKIMTIRHALREQGYMKYEPLKIAFNTSNQTAILIEEMGMDLPGISVSIEPIRNYPNYNLASHILGYLGKIANESEIAKFVDEYGYSKSNIIGKTGIEGKYELELRGEDGAKYVEVDAYGRNVKELDIINKPKPGEDIFLTIDIELQKVAGESLQHAIEQIQVGGEFKSKWGDYEYDAFKNASSGAVVTVDIHSGEILAMASYPSYDPNLFSTGISSTDWEKLQPDNKRDPIAARPLYNTATLTAVQPGSTFKMITGLAAVDNGLDPTKKYYDGRYIMIGNKSFGSWMWNDYRMSHGYIDLYKAIEESVNYYFFNISNGYDHYKKTPLGVPVNIEVVMEYANKFGLGEKTGVEISEVSYGVPDPESKGRTIKSLLKRKLQSSAKDYFTQEMLNSEGKLNIAFDEIISWADENPSRNEIIRRLSGLDILQDGKTEKLGDLIKYSYFNDMDFKVGDGYNLSIGQGAHAYTPIQMARYLSAISNGGYLNELTLVKRVGDQEIIKENTRVKIDLNDDESLYHINKGMLQVTKGSKGSARKVFHEDFPIDVAGKTGTAQRFGKIPPKDEIEYLQKNLRNIAPQLSIEMVNGETARIIEERNIELTKLQEDGRTDEVVSKLQTDYLDEGKIMRKAIKNLTNNRITDENIDIFRDDYDNFAWFVATAPYDDPKIAVVVLIFQGGHGGYGAPVAREIIAKYMGIDKSLEENNNEVNGHSEE